MPDSFSNVLHDVKISELPVADHANATDQLEANQAGTTRSITLDQVSSLVANSDQIGGVIEAAVAALGIVHVKDYGALGVADDTAAILAAATAALATNVPLHFSPIVYTVSHIIFPTGLPIRFNGATLRADGTVTGNNYIVTITGGSFDGLTVTTPAVTAKVPIIIGGGCRGGSIRLVADAQSNNALGTSNTGALRIFGDNITLGDLYVENFDYGAKIGGDAGVTGHNIHIGRYQGKSQISAILFHDLIGFSATELWGDVLSPNATAGDGGYGSMFGTAGCQDVNIGSVWGRGAREHMWRCGGQLGSAVVSKNITIGRITAINPCKSGVKVNNEELDGEAKYTGIDIGPILVINAGFASSADENGNGLLVEDVDGGSFGPVTVINTDGVANSGFYGIAIRNCTHVSIRPGSLIRNCANAGVFLSWRSQDLTYAIGALSHVYIGKTSVYNAGGHACYIDAPGKVIENVIVDIDSDITAGSAWNVVAGGATLPVILRGNARSAAAQYTGLADDDIILDYGINTPAVRMNGTVAYTSSATAIYLDQFKMVQMNLAGANTYTIPPAATVAFPIGTFINVTQYGAGATTIVAGVGVTIRNAAGLKLASQYAVSTVEKIGANEWIAGGALTT